MFLPEELEHIAEILDEESPRTILEWGWSHYAPRMAIVSNYGPGTLVVLHYAVELDPTIPVLHLDTGFEFPETTELGRRLEDHYGIRILRIRPDLSPQEQAQKYGDHLYHVDPDFCCYLRKVEPLDKALKNYDAWVSGIRRSQSETRRNVRVVEWDGRREMVKLNPLAHWSHEEVWNFIREHAIPYNPLHDVGYPSIGCMPCTQPVAEGESERAGRWNGFAKTECGLHVAHFAPKPSLVKE